METIEHILGYIFFVSIDYDIYLQDIIISGTFAEQKLYVLVYTQYTIVYLYT